MNAENTYVREVHYYETDRMGIVHHSNYVRWLEEARMAYMCRRAINYTEIEAKGVLMPVVSVSCSYKQSARFGDSVAIETYLSSFNGVRATYSYKIYLINGGRLLATARSEHCFVDEATRKPVNLKRRLPDEYGVMLAITESEAEQGGNIINE